MYDNHPPASSLSYNKNIVTFNMVGNLMKIFFGDGFINVKKLYIVKKTFFILRHYSYLISVFQVPTTMDAFMCYGPVVPNGYGICYNPHETYMLIAVTSFKDCGETRSDFYASTLDNSFIQMHELLTKTSHAAPNNGCVNGSAQKEGTGKSAQSPKRTKLVRQEVTQMDGLHGSVNRSGKI